MGHGKNPDQGKSSRARRDTQKANQRVPFADFRFVRIELLEGEKERFRDLLAAGEFAPLDADEFIVEGYTVKYTYDDKAKTVICSVSQPFVEHHNSGLVLTGRGRDTVTALAVCAFKHRYLCQDTLWREAEAQRGGSYDDIG